MLMSNNSPSNKPSSSYFALSVAYASLISASHPVQQKEMENQFVWTKKFHSILARFSEEVPVNANRHYFRSVPNSFSGKSALDTMEKVLAEIFPYANIQRHHTAKKVLELLLRDGVIVGVNKVYQIKDEKDVYYRFGKPITTEKYLSRPRRSVSVDQCKRLVEAKISVSQGNFSSEPEICAASSTSSNALNGSIVSSMENVSEKERKPNRIEIDTTALRFLRWISHDETISENQRRKTVKAFKAHYPQAYRNFLTQQKSLSISSDPQCITDYQRQQSIEMESRSQPLSPSTSRYSIQSDLDECGQHQYATSSPKKRNLGLSEADITSQLTQKLNSVTEDPVYSVSERQRILKYFKHHYPAIYLKQFGQEERPLLKKIREFFPKIVLA